MQKNHHPPKALPPFARLLVGETTILFIIVINAIAMILDGFPNIKQHTSFFYWVDYGCAWYFVFELFLKVKLLSWRGYWQENWNRFDFIVVVLSLPFLLDPILQLHAFAALLLLRLTRLIRFMKMLRFIPEADKLLAGLVRSLKASVGVFLALFLLNLIL